MTQCPALLHLLLFLPAPGEADNLSTTQISMMVAMQYPTITMIIEIVTSWVTSDMFNQYPGIASGGWKEVELWTDGDVIRHGKICVMVAV